MLTLALLNQQKNILLADLENWPAERLRFRPAPHAWSASQIVDHLIKTEAAFLDCARQGLANPRRVGLRDRLGYIMVQRVIATDRKVKVPASATMVLPEQDPDLDVLCQRWHLLRSDLQVFCASLSPEQRSQAVARHPVAGWMDIQRILGFFNVHITHHQYQLARLRNASTHA